MVIKNTEFDDDFKFAEMVLRIAPRTTKTSARVVKTENLKLLANLTLQEHFFLLEFHFVIISGLGGSIFSKKVKIVFYLSHVQKSGKSHAKIS